MPFYCLNNYAPRTIRHQTRIISVTCVLTEMQLSEPGFDQCRCLSKQIYLCVRVLAGLYVDLVVDDTFEVILKSYILLQLFLIWFCTFWEINFFTTI